MELRQYFNTIRKWLWLILLSTAVATFSSFLATRQQPPIYAAKTTLMVGRTIENPNPSGNDIWLGQQLAQTYSELARRSTVQEATKASLGLSWLPEYTVSLVPNTQLLDIRVVDTSPERAAAVANALAAQLIEQSPSASERERLERRDFVNQQLVELETNIDATKARIQELQDQLAGMFSARQIADTQTQIAALEQKLNGYQANYSSLLGFLEGGINTLRVVEPATVPTIPIGPNKALTILLAATIGLALAVGAAFLLDYLDDTLKNPDDIKEASGLATLGAITLIPGETLAEKLIAAQSTKSPTVEAYRILRTNIQFSALDNPPRTLLITSSNPAEGKSITAANLAVVMAQQGQRVVLVDTDLRRPTLHRIFKIPNNLGLTNALLAATVPIGDFVQESGIENLNVFTSGPLPPNPAELLGSARFAGLLQALREEFDVVLFDSPPALAVADVAILARQMDGVLLVVKADSTRRQWLANTRETLEKIGANILGVTINQIKPRGSGYYYYYYYHQYDYYSRDGQGKGPGGRREDVQAKGWRRLLPRSG